MSTVLLIVVILLRASSCCELLGLYIILSSTMIIRTIVIKQLIDSAFIGSHLSEATGAEDCQEI